MTNKTELTFEQYVVLAHEAATLNRSWRTGQAYFNVLWRERPDLSENEMIRGGPLDPFHRTDMLPEFLKWVEENW